MCSRFAFALLFSAVLPARSAAQQVTSDVVVQRASLNDGYQGWIACGVDGQVYRGSGQRCHEIRDARFAGRIEFVVYTA